MLSHVRKAAEAVSGRSRHVSIDDGRLSALASGLRDVAMPEWDMAMHFFSAEGGSASGGDGTSKTIMYTLLLDAVNFCFWPSAFTVEYKGKVYGREDGYCALAVALKRAFEAEVPLWDASFLAGMGEETWARIMRGGGEVPLMAERLANARNVGSVLRDEFGGDPWRLIAAAEGSAPALALLLAKKFSAYRDSRTYDGVRFDVLKRAQICVSDLVGAFAGRGTLALEDTDGLTCFADYKLPQLFHCRGAFVYAPELEAKVMGGTLLPEDSPEEVEIRANTIVAVERMKDVLAGQGRKLSARDIDWLLWNESVFGEPLKAPHHKTITTSY